MNKYSQIRNLEELEAAQLKITRKIYKKEKDVKNRFSGIKEFYTPSNLVSTGFKKIAEEVPAKDFLLLIIQKFKERLAR